MFSSLAKLTKERSTAKAAASDKPSNPAVPVPARDEGAQAEKRPRLDDGSRADPPPAADTAKAEEIPDAASVKQRLRNLRAPVTLFGESDEDRYKRLMVVAETGVAAGRQPTSLADRAHEIQRIEQGKTQAQIEAEYTTLQTMTTGALESVVADCDAQLAAKPTQEDFVLLWLRKLMAHWEMNLCKRSLSETLASRKATEVFKSSQQSLRPLQEALENDTLDASISMHLFQIFANVQVKDHAKAEEAYLRLAIGDAPWVLGVWMVGIHHRRAREQIQCGRVKHLLNNRTVQQYLLVVKRLLNLAKEIAPAEPSRM